MNFNHLYHLHIIAEEGSLAGAGHRLSLSSSTLSEQLKKIEDFFGMPLSERTSQGLHLTDQGRILHSFTREMFRVHGRIVSFFQLPVHTGLIAPIEIGICEGIGEMLPASLYQYLFSGREYISIHTDSKESLLQKIRQHLLDLVFDFCTEDERSSSELHTQGISPVCLGIFCHPAQEKMVDGKVKKGVRIPLLLQRRMMSFADIFLRELSSRKVSIDTINSFETSVEIQEVLSVTEAIALLPVRSILRCETRQNLLPLDYPDITIGEIRLLSARSESSSFIREIRAIS
ncbi:MAG: LysR family transcriptional regulator [Bdellovibrionota bacterium]